MDIVTLAKPLAKTIDVVLFGVDNAGSESQMDLSTPASTESVDQTALEGMEANQNPKLGGLGITLIVLGSLAGMAFFSVGALFFGLVDFKFFGLNGRKKSKNVATHRKSLAK